MRVSQLSIQKWLVATGHLPFCVQIKEWVSDRQVTVTSATDPRVRSHPQLKIP